MGDGVRQRDAVLEGAESRGSSIRRDGRREEVFTLNRGPLQSSLPTTQCLSLLSPFYSIMNSSLLFTLLLGVAIVVAQQYDDEEIGLVSFYY